MFQRGLPQNPLQTQVGPAAGQSIHNQDDQGREGEREREREGDGGPSAGQKRGRTGVERAQNKPDQEQTNGRFLSQFELY